MILILLLAIAATVASAPARAAEAGASAGDYTHVAARIEGAVGLGPLGGGPGAGVGVAAGVPLGRVLVEADFGVGADVAPSPRVTAFLGARFELGGPDDGRFGTFALTGLAGGGWWRGETRPLARVGFAYDTPLRHGRVLRLGVAWQGGGGGAGAVLTGLGVAWRIGPKAAPVPVAAAVEEVAPPPEPAPAPPPSRLTVIPPDALVWVPHPVCDWVPASRLAEVLPPDLAGVTVQIRAPGYLPTDVTLLGDTPASIALRPAPAFGAVVVVAHPGDRVSIGRDVVPIGPDGTGVFGAAEGPVTVEVVGGGRRVVLRGAIAGGYALWLRAPAPTPLIVMFAAGSSEVPPEAAASIRAYAAALGSSTVRVVGTYAADEVSDGRRLGVKRAEALAASLIGAGLPADVVKVLASAKPSAGGDVVEADRAAWIEAVPAEEPR
ncbi:MAG: hypothetical protein Q8P41_24675 [Pseudomonadota bacterium]|nr:hypothetical protein [Pseudomonadota bacterium]